MGHHRLHGILVAKHQNHHTPPPTKMSINDLKNAKLLIDSAINIFGGFTEITISDPTQTIIVRPKSFVKIIKKKPKP